jgi:hypothetical protein
MPRWLLVTLAVLLATLWWLAHRNSAPLAAMTAAGGAAPACNALMVPKTLDGAVQSAQGAAPFRVNDALLTPLAAFSVAGRVLGREDYHFDRGAAWSPVDLALGWGPMAEPGMAERLQVTQGGRWYHYSWGNEGPPLAPDQIVLDSANMHMVPADAAAAAALARVRAGEKLRIDGWLLRIEGDDGFRWESSLSRDDMGAGACELVLVCTVQPN